MMTKTHVQVFALAVILSAVGAASAAAHDSDGTATDTTLQDIAGYKQWTRVTDKPTPVGNASPAG